jgi:AcrR family transcriptional regulator
VKAATLDLRRKLLDASLDLIAAEGLERFSMREVARRAGVSHQAPYHYFPDREAILAEIVAEGFRRLREEMVAALRGVDDPTARLTAIGKAYVGFALNQPAYFKLMFRSELVNAERHDKAQSCAGSAFDVLVSAVNDLPMKKKRASGDQSLVFAAWSTAHGLATLLLEGKLDEHSGKSKRARAATAAAVLEAFSELVRRT